MSSLTDSEKRYLEELLGMRSGYVLDYSDASFGTLFSRYKIDIHGSKYRTHGTSKAKKMRAFWEQESDILVGKILSEMLDSYKADCDLNNQKLNTPLLEKSRGVVTRLSGGPVSKSPL